MFYSLIKIIAKVILSIVYRIDVKGIENLPADGRLIVCSNHKSNWDPIIISIALPRQIAWMGKKELFKNKLLGAFLTKLTVFPVDRDGSDLSAIKKALRILKEERVIGIFPEGTRVKGLDLNNAKSGVALLGYKSKSPILPIYIEGTYKIFSKINVSLGPPLKLNELIDGKPSGDDYLDLSKQILINIYDLNEDMGGN